MYNFAPLVLLQPLLFLRKEKFRFRTCCGNWWEEEVFLFCLFVFRPRWSASASFARRRSWCRFLPWSASSASRGRWYVSFVVEGVRVGEMWFEPVYGDPLLQIVAVVVQTVVQFERFVLSF